MPNDLAAKLKRRFDNWQTALNDSDQTVRQCQMKRVMFQAELEDAYRAGNLIPLDQHNALMAVEVDFPETWRDDAHAIHAGPGLKAQRTWAAGFNACRDAIRALTQADATAALERLISRAREEERERLLKWVSDIRQSVLRCVDLRAEEEGAAMLWLDNFNVAISEKGAVRIHSALSEPPAIRADVREG